MKKSGDLSSLFSMILLLVITVASFMVVLYQVNAFQIMEKENEKTNLEHLPYSYLSQRLRRATRIEVEDNTLIIVEGDMVSYIYLNEDNMMELTTLSSLSFDKSLGEKLFDMNDFNIDLKDKGMIIEYRVGDTCKVIEYAFRGTQHE